MRLTDFRIRDTFILPYEGKYYLYGTRLTYPLGFEVYISENLEEWEGPYEVFRESKDFWATQDYWGPEVYVYQGYFYMFANFKAEGICRGTQVLIAESPLGPFREHSDGPVTPREKECLDGTLYIDETGQPYMIFCQEWVQCQDGVMYVGKLDMELKTMISDPIPLFRGSDASWTISIEGEGNFVTDGPYVFKAQSGILYMLWSSIHEHGFVQGVAVQKEGMIEGKWDLEHPVLVEDGGHGMLFKDFEGKLMMVLHTPNAEEKEHATLFEMEEADGVLRIKR